jgi:glycosyltransferase involved in cell wall biosynthesis
MILFFGKIDDYKGLDILIEAFNGLRLAETRLVIAGAFRSGECRERIMAQIAGSPRKGDISFNERAVPNEEIEVFFKACEVLCLPYRNIYQSGVYFLGARFGIPMVATRVGSLAEFVTPEAGLLAETNDPAGVREALGRFFAAPGRFRRDKIAAAAERFRWDRVCRDIVPLYAMGNGTEGRPELLSA